MASTEVGVEQERGQAMEIAGVEGRAELVNDAGPRGATASVGLDQLAASAVKRRLHRADSGRQDLGNLVEAEVEDVLSTTAARSCGPSRTSRVPAASRVSRSGAPGSSVGRPRRLRNRVGGGGGTRSRAAPPQLVNPQVRRDPEQPGARVARRLAHPAQGDEGPGQGVLHQVLGVPGLRLRWRRSR